MSMGIYPVFHPKKWGTGFKALGEVLLSNIETLNEMATSANILPLTAFADNREVPPDFEGNLGDLTEVLTEWKEWFEPADGSVAVQGLVELITKRKDLKDVQEVTAELQELVRVLEVAKSQGIKFRLQVG